MWRTPKGGRPAKGRATKGREPNTIKIAYRTFYASDIRLAQRLADYTAAEEGNAECWIDVPISELSSKNLKCGRYRIILSDENVGFTIEPDPSPPIPVIVTFDDEPEASVEEEEPVDDDDEEDDDD